MRLLFSSGTTGVAILITNRSWGLLNNINISHWMAVVLSVVLLDFAIYLQHVIFHAVPALWCLHMVHHTDLDLDVTSGTRFHPVEILLSMCIKIGILAVLGAPPMAVLVFEVLLNAAAMFNHSNIFIPDKVDRILRYLIITQDMHRVHHSVITKESNSNFGFNFPWWDLLLRTYRPQPAAGHINMTIDLPKFRDPKCLNLLSLLRMPFVKPADMTTISHKM